MVIERTVHLNDNVYYVLVDVEYQISDNGNTMLCLKSGIDKYYDGGDFSLLIKFVEKKYNEDVVKKYDKNISFMADIIYLYDNIPFLSGVREVYVSKKNNIPYNIVSISRDEIEKYIKIHKIKLNTNNEFKLFDQRTWN